LRGEKPLSYHQRKQQKTLPREGVVKGRRRKMKRMKRKRKKKKRRRRKRRKKALEAQVKQQTGVAPREEWERVKGTLLERELEVETEQWHSRMERDMVEERHQKWGQEERQWEGGEEVEWQQLK
jgi:hypothetical protein